MQGRPELLIIIFYLQCELQGPLLIALPEKSYANQY